MILKQEEFVDTITGADSEQEFSIDTDSSVIFEILRDKMYKDKIGSICREVASNSRDANREANSDKPVEIEIFTPNRLLSSSHPTISFKDYGAGISPKKMADIYLKYGASDKRTSNKLTGGFGLGAKTPFAYNDTFTVITVADWAEPITEEYTVEVADEISDDGEVLSHKKVTKTRVIGHKPERRMKWKYTAMIDSSQKGKMVCFDSSETDEPTGTTVIVPIKCSDDRYKFEREALKYTKTWGDEVEYKGFTYTQENLELAYDDENFTIYKSDTYRSFRMELLIDGIPYPLETDTVGITDSIGRNNSNYLTVLKFETGELTISANRESVQYDDDTINAIKEKHTEVLRKLDELTADHVSSQESYVDACMLTYYINRKSSNHINPPALTGAILAHSKSSGHKLKNATWNGWKTVDDFVFKHHNVYRVYLENYTRNRYEPTRTFSFTEKNLQTKIVYADTRKNSARNANLWEAGEGQFFLIKPIEENSKEAIEEFMTFIYAFDRDFNLYSEYEPVKAEKSDYVYEKKSYVTLNVRTIDGYFGLEKDTISLDRKTFEAEESDIDFTKTVYTTVEKLSRAEYLDTSKLKLCSKNGFKALVVREQDYQNWFSNTSMRHIDDVYEEVKNEIAEKLRDKALNIMIGERLESQVYGIEKFYEELKPILPKSAQNADFNQTLSYQEKDIVKDFIKFDFNGLERKINSIFGEKYPLLDLIIKKYRYDYKVDKGIEQIKLYINQVNCYYGN